MLDTQGPPPDTERKRTRRQKDVFFTLVVLALGVVTVFALSRGADAFTPRASHVASRPSTVTSSAARAKSTPTIPKGVLPAQLATYPIPEQNADLMQPSVDRHGNVWVGEMGLNRLARVDTSTGKVSSWEPPNGQFGIMATAIAPDGAVWFTEQSANYVGRFDPSTATFKTYSAGMVNGRPAAPQDLAIDASGNIWFTDVTAGNIAELDPATGHIRTWPVPPVAPGDPVYPYGIALGPGGTVWFSELAGGTLGRLDPKSGQVQLFRTPTSDAQIFSLAIAPDGRVWFTELQYGRLGVIDPKTGSVSELDVPQPFSSVPNVYDVVVDASGAVWAASMGQNSIVRYVPGTGTFTLFALPDASTLPYGLALDPNGRVWFSADRTPINYVGVLNV
jgi:virginiamycin B lyase